MSIGMMMSMLPPGMAQLYDSLPAPDVLKRVAEGLANGEGKYPADVEDCQAVGKFLDMLAQLLAQQVLTEESKTQTEPLKLYCSECGKEFAVDNAYQYRRRVEEGFLCACADGHEPHVIGSGRLGELTPDEALTYHNDPTIKVIFPKDYSDESNDNPSD